MQKKAKMSLEKRHNLTGWAFLIPAALLIFIFCFYVLYFYIDLIIKASKSPSIYYTD